MESVSNESIKSKFEFKQINNGSIAQFKTKIVEIPKKNLGIDHIDSEPPTKDTFIDHTDSGPQNANFPEKLFELQVQNFSDIFTTPVSQTINETKSKLDSL